MTNPFKNVVLATALAATALTGAAPAMADGYRGGYYHHGGNGAGLAIGAGIVGLAVGALIASNAHHDDRYDHRYYPNNYNPNGYYATPYPQPYWTWHDGYYWDHAGHRYDGYRHYDRGYDWHGYDWHGYDRRGYGGGYRYDGYRGDPRPYEGRGY